MTRKDYIAIAESIRVVVEAYQVETNSERRTSGVLAASEIAQSLVPIMKADNPRFDEAVFLRACRVI